MEFFKQITLDVNTFLIVSLLLNIFLIIRYVIKGPRKPRDADEIISSLENVSEYLGYDLVAVESSDTEGDSFLLSHPDKTDYYINKLNKNEQ